MARYIDAEKCCEYFDKEYKELRQLIYQGEAVHSIEAGFVGAERAIHKIPTADVAPKSEVEKLITLNSQLEAKLFEERKAKVEWISVEERLPETEGDYLVWNKAQKRIENRFFYRLPPHYPVESHPEIREYFGNFADYKIITHWMPLPEVPKGGAE